MRPRYGTTALVLGRSAVAEGSVVLHLLTDEFGLLCARAQGLRSSGAKLASAVQTLSECTVILVRGKEVWRLSGAHLVRNRFRELSPSSRARAHKTARLILRLVQGETHDPSLFTAYRDYLTALPSLTDTQADSAECLIALQLLGILGLDAGGFPQGELYSEESLKEIEESRREYILRINRGITASGL